MQHKAEPKTETGQNISPKNTKQDEKMITSVEDQEVLLQLLNSYTQNLKLKENRNNGRNYVMTLSQHQALTQHMNNIVENTRAQIEEQNQNSNVHMTQMNPLKFDDSELLTDKSDSASEALPVERNNAIQNIGAHTNGFFFHSDTSNPVQTQYQKLFGSSDSDDYTEKSTECSLEDDHDFTTTDLDYSDHEEIDNPVKEYRKEDKRHRSCFLQ